MVAGYDPDSILSFYLRIGTYQYFHILILQLLRKAVLTATWVVFKGIEVQFL